MSRELADSPSCGFPDDVINGQSPKNQNRQLKRAHAEPCQRNCHTYQLPVDFPTSGFLVQGLLQKNTWWCYKQS
jgi:hypothetical protein